MLAPDLTYGYAYPKDVSGLTFEVYTRSQGLSDTATPLVTTLTDVPKDRLLCLSNVSVVAQPGTGQHVTNIQIQGQTAAGLLFEIAFGERPLTVDRDEVLNWQGQVYILGTGTGNIILQCRVAFDSGVQNNVMGVDWHGIVVPRGNSAQY